MSLTLFSVNTVIVTKLWQCNNNNNNNNTLCMNPVAWKLRASEGYKLSKPLSTKITDLLYVDDLKAFAASEIKLNKVLKSTKSAMQDIGLEWNPKKCTTVHVRRGVQVKDETGVQLDDGAVLTKLI